jgi:hypothetical protein
MTWTVLYFIYTCTVKLMQSESKFVTEYRECLMAGKFDRCVGLTILSTLRADCHVICNPRPPETIMVFSGLYRDSFILFNGLNFTNAAKKCDYILIPSFTSLLKRKSLQ